MADAQHSESETVEPTEAATEAREQAPFDPFGPSTEDLRRKIESDMFAEPEQAEVVAEAEATSDDDEPEVSEPEADEDEVVAEDAEVTEAQELRAMLEEQEARSKHFESMLGRQTGEEGYFKRKVAELEQRLAESKQGGDSEDFAETAPRRAKPAADSSTTYLIELAVRNASESFLKSTPGVYALDKDGNSQIDPQSGQVALEPEFQNAIAGVADQIRATLNMDDPIAAGQEASRLLSSAWAKADLVKKRARRIEIQRRRGEQGKRLKDKKRASASASTGAAPPRTKKREADPRNMTTDEIRKLAEKESEEAGL